MNDDTRDMRDSRPAGHAAGSGPTPPGQPSIGTPGSGSADGHVSPEVIAAWLDTPDDFDATERETIATHIAGCATCRAVAEDLHQVVSALATLPQVSAPRSFSLTRNMVEEDASRRETPAGRAPVRMRETNAWHERRYRAVRWATAVAAVLFVFVLSLDLVTNRLDPSAGGDDAAMSVQTEMTTGGAAAEQAPEDAAGGAVAEEPSDDLRAADEPDAAEESSEMEIAVAEEETAGQADEAQGDAASTPANAEANEESSTASQPAEESTGESADTMAVTESDADEERDASGDADTFAATGQTAQPAVEESSERLRIIQVALALILVWLLAAMIALSRTRRG